MGPGGAKAAQVEDRRVQRHADRRIVQLGVMRQRHYGGARIGGKGGHRLVRPVGQDGFARKARGRAESIARIDQHRIIAAGARHLQQRLGNMDGPHDDHPQGRVVDGDEDAVLFHPRPVGPETGLHGGVVRTVRQPVRPCCGIRQQGGGRTGGARRDKIGQQRLGQLCPHRHYHDPDRAAAG